MDVKKKFPRVGAIFKKTLLILVSILLVLFFTCLGLFIFLNQAPEKDVKNANEDVFVIGKGEGLSEIARHLEESGHIRSALFLQIYGKVLATEAEFKSGSYRLPPGLKTTEIHDYLVSGKQILIKVTIPVGLTSRQIGLQLDKSGICKAEEFLAAVKDSSGLKIPDLEGLPGAEGFLFPDTYLFAAETPPSTIIREMVKNFFSHLDQITSGRPDADVLHETLILSSIIEKEYVDPEEAPLMASVFLNRLKIGKGLESCATIVYVMTEEQGLPHPTRIYYRDLARKSPYNTYMHSGLPPGPISNPGKVALEAGFHPASTDYLYFVLKGQDAVRHHFSRTFTEHSQASVFYLKKQ